MAKVFGIISLELNPGVQAEEFIRFFNDQYAALGARLGWKGSVLQADKGERMGKLAVIWEIENQEQRDRYALAAGGLTDEGKRVLEPDFSLLGETWEKLVAHGESTDYVIQA